jgi:ACR3 family arsenite efflux pump ArsB
VLEDDPSMLLRVVAPIVAYFAIVFVLTLVVARVRRMSFERTVVLVFTTASRNSEASLAIAVTAFASPLVAAVVAIGPAIELPILVLMVRMLSAVGRRWPAAPQPVIAAPTRHDIALARAGDDA